MQERPSNREYLLMLLPFLALLLVSAFATNPSLTGQFISFGTPSDRTNVQTGSLSVNSAPSGAIAYLDNVFKGTTPLTITGVSAGYHSVKLTKSGYYDYLANVYVPPKRTAVLNAILTPIIPINNTGSLFVSSTPSAAPLFVDNVFKGLTPITVSGLSAGSHSVKVSKTGYFDFVTTVSISAGLTTTLSVVLTPITNQTNATF